MRAAIVTALIFGVLAMATGARAADRWIQYGKPNEPSTQDEYHRVDWERLALVIFDNTPGREGVHLWSSEESRVFQLGTTSFKSESAEVIRKLLQAESNRWIKGFVYGGPGKPGQPDRLDAYCDLSKAKVVAPAHPIEAKDNVFIKVSFDEGAPAVGISDERAYTRIRGIMEASVTLGKRYRNTTAATYPSVDRMEPVVERAPAAPAVKKLAKPPVAKVVSPRTGASRSSYRRSIRSASRGGRSRGRFAKKPSASKKTAQKSAPKKPSPQVGRYLP